MPVLSRVDWMCRQLAMGRRARITVGQARDRNKVKVKVVLDAAHDGAMDAFAAAGVHAILLLVRDWIISHRAVDRGHKHSDQSSEVSIWISGLGAADVPVDSLISMARGPPTPQEEGMENARAVLAEPYGSNAPPLGQMPGTYDDGRGSADASLSTEASRFRFNPDAPEFVPVSDSPVLSPRDECAVPSSAATPAAAAASSSTRAVPLLQPRASPAQVPSLALTMPRVLSTAQATWPVVASQSAVPPSSAAVHGASWQPMATDVGVEEVAPANLTADRFLTFNSLADADRVRASCRRLADVYLQIAAGRL